MAKRPKDRPTRRAKVTRSARARTVSRRSVKRPSKKAQPKRQATARKRPKPVKKPARKRPATTRATTRRAAPPPATGPAGPAPRKSAGARGKIPRLERTRRTLDEIVPSPPSSLNMDRHATSARSGAAEIAESLTDHRGMSSAITGGDVDVDVENAYFTGDEAPGGDNPTPDQEVVDDIGKALGVQYDDNEELKASDKILERDRHRWEMDPASSEDYKERR